MEKWTFSGKLLFTLYGCCPSLLNWTGLTYPPLHRTNESHCNCQDDGLWWYTVDLRIRELLRTGEMRTCGGDTAHSENQVSCWLALFSARPLSIKSDPIPPLGRCFHYPISIVSHYSVRMGPHMKVVGWLCGGGYLRCVLTNLPPLPKRTRAAPNIWTVFDLEKRKSTDLRW